MGSIVGYSDRWAMRLRRVQPCCPCSCWTIVLTGIGQSIVCLNLLYIPPRECLVESRQISQRRKNRICTPRLLRQRRVPRAINNDSINTRRGRGLRLCINKSASSSLSLIM